MSSRHSFYKVLFFSFISNVSKYPVASSTVLMFDLKLVSAKKDVFMTTTMSIHLVIVS